MKVRDIMTTDVACAAPDTTLEEIATMMRDEDTGAIPIVEDEALVGIVTDRDIVVRCIAEGKDANECTAEDILSENLETIEPEDDVSEASQIMARRQVRRLPVVEDGRLVGMLSLGDIAVKHHDDRESGDTLESVSEGVKKEDNRNRGQQKQKQVRQQPAAQHDDQRTRAAQRQDLERGDANTARMMNEATEGQGIANHDVNEENRRQSKVVPFRNEGKGSGKRRVS